MSERDFKGRRVSGRQLDLLWEFLNSHRDIACAYNRSLQAKEYALKKWKEAAELLNAQGDGAHKDWRGWSKYWVDYKAKLKKRSSAVRSSQTRTGGGPSMEPPLNAIEVKFLQILGENFGQGLPGIRVEPFPEPSTSSVTCSQQDSPFSESILINIPCLQEISPSPHLPIQPPLSHPRAPTPAPAPAPAAAPPARPLRSPRRRRRREPPISQEAARRALIRSSQLRADAAQRSSETLEMMNQNIARIHDTLQHIQSYMALIFDAFPRAAE